jgi:hypothetical protein
MLLMCVPETLDEESHMIKGIFLNYKSKMQVYTATYTMI